VDIVLFPLVLWCGEVNSFFLFLLLRGGGRPPVCCFFVREQDLILGLPFWEICYMRMLLGTNCMYILLHPQLMPSKFHPLRCVLEYTTPVQTCP